MKSLQQLTTMATFFLALLVQEGGSFALPPSFVGRFVGLNSQSSRLTLQSSSTPPLFPTPYDPRTTTQQEQEVSDDPHVDSLQQFNQDVTKVIKDLRSGPDQTVPEIFRERSPHLSMAYLWTDKDWERQMSRRRRYIRGIIFMYRSRLMKRIIPQLSICVLWSFVVSTFIMKRSSVLKLFDFSMTGLSLVSTFVAALLTLRSNQGLNRLADARSAWGRLISISRDTAQALALYVYPKNPQLGILAGRHLSIFGWLLKCRLREEDDNDIIQTMLPKIDASYVAGERKHSVALIHRIRQIIGHMAADGSLPYGAHSQLEYNLWYLNRIFGRCERVKGSCIPPLYTAHVTRLLVFYLCFLPFALGRSFAVIPTTFITGAVAFAMMGLDEIGHILEQPFRYVIVTKAVCRKKEELSRVVAPRYTLFP